MPFIDINFPNESASCRIDYLNYVLDDLKDNIKKIGLW